ncbi:MAG: hypothetical protein JNK35_05595 [Phycisphaerae bacterium]|nr:hypothetical protein [Phycisphaerae bacterium]
MSDSPAGTPSLREDLRLALSGLAAGTERRNRPRILIIGASAVLAASLGWLGIAWWRAGDAADTTLREQSTTLRVQTGLDAYFAEKKAQADALGENALAPDPAIQGVIERSARDAGLASITLSAGEDRRQGPKNLRRRTFSLQNSQPLDAESVLRWVERVQQTVPGVELSVFDAEPALATVEGKPRWKIVNITFTRWERK